MKVKRKRGWPKKVLLCVADHTNEGKNVSDLRCTLYIRFNTIEKQNTAEIKCNRFLSFSIVLGRLFPKAIKVNFFDGNLLVVSRSIFVISCRRNQLNVFKKRGKNSGRKKGKEIGEREGRPTDREHSSSHTFYCVPSLILRRYDAIKYPSSRITGDVETTR